MCVSIAQDGQNILFTQLSKYSFRFYVASPFIFLILYLIRTVIFLYLISLLIIYFMDLPVTQMLLSSALQTVLSQQTPSVAGGRITTACLISRGQLS